MRFIILANLAIEPLLFYFSYQQIDMNMLAYGYFYSSPNKYCPYPLFFKGSAMLCNCSLEINPMR